jgi:hypothetical protein
MKSRIGWIAMVLVGAAALGGCDATSGAPEPAPVATVPSPRTAALAPLPAGAPCSAKINHYRSVLEADHTTGNVDPEIYAQISQEIGNAASACAAGRNGEALSLIQASQARHGYHT